MMLQSVDNCSVFLLLFYNVCYMLSAVDIIVQLFINIVQNTPLTIVQHALYF